MQRPLRVLGSFLSNDEQQGLVPSLLLEFKALQLPKAKPQRVSFEKVVGGGHGPPLSERRHNAPSRRAFGATKRPEPSEGDKQFCFCSLSNACNKAYKPTQGLG